MAVPDDTLVPIPPRYWWLKRILLATVLLIVGLASLRWWWGVQADHRWRACIARLEASGEPLYARDFAVPAIPDAENAAHLLKAAAAKMKPGGLSFSQLVDALDLPGRDRDVAQALTDNAESLRLLRQVRDTRGSDWGIDNRTGDISGQFQLAHLAQLASIAAYWRGDAHEALEGVHDLLCAGRAIRANRSFPGHLIGMEADQCAVRIVERITPDSTAVGPSGSLGRDEIRGLVDSFLDESEVRASWRWAWLSERALQLELVRPIAELRSPGLLAPALTIDAATVMDWGSQSIAMAEATNAVAAHRRYPAASDPGQKLNRYARLLSAFVIPDFSSVLDEHFKRLALRRLAAARLGIALCALDHGNLPETLEQLVPVYLPAVPLDPLFDDGRPIEYAPSGPDAGLFAGRPRDPVALRLIPSADEQRAESASTQAVEHQHDIER